MNIDKNVLVVGAGYWGRKVIEEYVSLSNINEVGKIFVFDTNSTLLDFRYKNVICASDLETLLPKVSFAHICTPNLTHASIAEKLLSRDIAILIEKPVSEVPQEAKFLLDESLKHSRKLRVGMLYRFSQTVNKAKSILEAKLGEPHHIYASWLHNIDVPNIRRVMLQRDVVWDILIHLLDVVSYLFDDRWPLLTYGSGLSASSGLNHSFLAAGSVEGANLVMNCSYLSHFKERKVELMCANGNMTIDLLNNILSYGTDEEQVKLSFYDNPLRTELMAFLDNDMPGDARNDIKVGYMETKLLHEVVTNCAQKKRGAE